MFFLRNKFWCTGIQNLFFFSSDLEFWIGVNEHSVVDIPTQILLTILLSIDYSSRCELKVYIIAYNNNNKNIYDILIFFAKLLRQWQKSEQNVSLNVYCYYLFIYSNSKSLVEIRTSNASTSGLIPKRNHLKFYRNITYAILSFIRNNTQTEWPYWVFWNLFDKTIRWASKWFILT